MVASNKIIVNGKEYSSINDVPAEFKVMFEDKNNNGIPDFVEGILAGAEDMKNSVHVSGKDSINANFTTFVYNGTQYSDMNQLPPDARTIVETSLAKLEKSGMKISGPLTDEKPFIHEQQWETDTDISSRNSENSLRKEVMSEEGPQLQPGFKFRIVMTIILFILAVVYISWLMKLI